MRKTPLFVTHQSGDAVMDTDRGWLVASSFGDLDAEYAAVRSGVGVLDLPWAGSVVLDGPDARRFSNGMFTNNIRKLQPGQGNRNAICDDRGRVQGFLDVYCVDAERFLCVLDGVTPTWFEETIGRFLVFDDVELTTQDNGPWVLSVQGPKANELLESLHLPVPEGPGDHLAVEGDDPIRVMRRDRFGAGGFDLLVPAAHVDVTWGALVAAGAQPVGAEAQEALRVAAGVPRWPEDGTDKTMVHELGVNEDVCAFDKGCYRGQEVINRIDVKGAINKRLSGLLLDEDVLPPAGAEVVHEGKVVGDVRSAARFEGKAAALAVVRKSAWEPGTAVVVRAGEREVGARVSALPFG